MLSNVIVVILIVIATIAFGTITVKLLWKAFFDRNNNKPPSRSAGVASESRIIVKKRV